LINIVYDATKLQDQLREIADDQVPFATSVALNETLKKTRNHIKSVMDNHIEGGATGFTKRGMRIYPTHKYDMNGAITFFALYGDPSKSRDYMQELMYGGVKKAKRSKLPEPAIDNLRQHAGSMFTARGNISQKLYSRTRGKNDKVFFRGIPKSGKPNWANNASLYGIWKREKGKIILLVGMKRSQRRQKQTFPAPEIAKQFFNANVEGEFARAVLFALRTMRFK